MFTGTSVSGRRSQRATARLAVALLVAGQATSGCLPGPNVPAGSRRLVITVTNESLAPAILEVAPMGLGGSGGGSGQQVGRARWVGVAQPASVPPGTQPVTFMVPPTND